jgi:dextranase
VLIEGINTDPEGACGKVWIIARQSESFETISLINLSNIPCPEWNSLLLTAPTLLNELPVRYYTEREVKRVWLASPDFANSQALLLEFKPGWDIRGNHVEFTVPRLEYWDLIVIEFAN